MVPRRGTSAKGNTAEVEAELVQQSTVNIAALITNIILCKIRIPSDLVRYICVFFRGGYMGMFPNSKLAKRLAGRYKSSRVDDWCKQEPSEDDPKRLIRCHHKLDPIS